MDRNETNEVAAIDVNHQVGAIDLNRRGGSGEPPLPKPLRTTSERKKLNENKKIHLSVYAD